MELVYLWVEDYKNIQNQGFNFSPRFNCEYDPDSNELTIDKNDDYIENFFGDNINVTAIVGKNGSGKSSLLEFILDRLAENINSDCANFIFIYSYENKLHEYSNFKYDTSSHVNLDKYPNFDHLLQYYNDLIVLHINSEYKDIEVRKTSKIFSENNKYDKKSSNLIFLENYIRNQPKLKKIEEKIFTPYKLKISIKTMGYSLSTLYDDQDYYLEKDWKIITDLIQSMKSKSFFERLKIIKEIFEKKHDLHKNKDEFILFDSRQAPHKYNINNDILRDIPEIFKECSSKDLEIIIDDIDSDTLTYIAKLPYVFEIDLYDEYNTSFDKLSFGEKQLLNQLHYILLYTSKHQYEEFVFDKSYDDGSYHYYDIKKVFIFLDEFEIGLHSQWQKKTINYIIRFLQILDIKVHLIVTTHSPFLLSDIPKQNIIFLDKDAEGKCIVVDGLKEKKQTFGANIHTLLSDSFFMEDGLMGEFAKGKIDEAIKYLNQEKLNEKELKYCEQIISIIGEPIVKNQLQRMLDSKRLKKVDEIDAIKQSMEAMQKRLDELEND